jgi:hypothetical protein
VDIDQIAFRIQGVITPALAGLFETLAIRWYTEFSPEGIIYSSFGLVSY